VTWARAWFDAVLDLASIQTTPIPGPHTIVPGHFIDVIPRNLIFDSDGTPFFFDQEWKLEEPIELGFIVYRSIFDSL
jgi:hypothetical protein